MRGLRFFRFRLVSISVLFSYDRSSARMVELVDTRDLKSRGPGRVRAGSSPAPGTKINNLAPVSFRSLRLVCATVPITVPKHFNFHLQFATVRPSPLGLAFGHIATSGVLLLLGPLRSRCYSGQRRCAFCGRLSSLPRVH